MTDRLYSTSEVCEILGVASRQTLYNWGAEPDERAPGARGVLLWSRATIERLADEHGRIPAWQVAT